MPSEPRLHGHHRGAPGGVRQGRLPHARRRVPRDQRGGVRRLGGGVESGGHQFERQGKEVSGGCRVDRKGFDYIGRDCHRR